MPGLLNASSTLMCPHGGTVKAVTSNTKVKVGGDFAVRKSDTFIISGCPFNLAGAPHPCVRVQWVVAATKGKVVGDLTLTESSVGLCLAADNAPQGTVMINSTQQKVAGM